MKSKRNAELTRLYFAAVLAAVSYTFFKLYKLFSYSEASVLGTTRWGGLLAIGLANTLVIGLIVFMVARALAKAYFERRGGVLGSKIRTKLVIAFLAVGIVPSAMLFVMGRPFILKNIERWFAPETDRLIRDGGTVSRLYRDERLAGVRRDAEVAAQLRQEPQIVLSEFGLDFCSDSKTTLVRNGLKEPILVGDARHSHFRTVNASAVDAGAAGTWYLGRHGAWVVGRLVPRDVQESLARLERRQEEAQQIRGLRNALVEFTDNVLLFMTLLTIFAAVWTGLTLLGPSPSQCGPSPRPALARRWP